MTNSPTTHTSHTEHVPASGFAGNLTVPGLLLSRARRTPSGIALRRQMDDGGWSQVSFAEYAGLVSILASVLADRGIVSGDAVGVIGESSPEWDIAQLAILACGAIVVGLDVYDSTDHINQLADELSLSALLVLDAELRARFDEPLRNKSRCLLTVGRIGKPGSGELGGWDDGADASGHVEGLASLLKQTAADAPALVIFTSGTTGAPKAIAYTHRQVCIAVDAILVNFDDIEEADHFVCWLPLANLFQRMVNFCAIVRGAVTYYVENPRKVVAELSHINPHIFVGVPRFYEKLYEGIMEVVERSPRWKRRVIAWALRVGDAHARSMRSRGKASFYATLVFPLADHFVLQPLRDSLGSNLRYLVSGSAPMPEWLLERYHAMGLLILEAYGLSENIVPIASNKVDAFKFGTVGQPLSGNEVMVDAEGQLWVRGPGLFSGYRFGQDRDWESRFNRAGYFATGDCAEIDASGYITLKGRADDVIKTSTGRRIAPLAIEQCLSAIPYVEHAVVVGAGRKHLGAILAVSAEELNKRLGTSSKGSARVNSSRDAERRMGEDVERMVRHLAHHHKPVAVLVIRRPFSTARGELTSNQKLRRKNIEHNLRDEIDALFAAADAVSRPDQAASPYIVVQQ